MTTEQLATLGWRYANHDAQYALAFKRADGAWDITIKPHQGPPVRCSVNVDRWCETETDAWAVMGSRCIDDSRGWAQALLSEL